MASLADLDLIPAYRKGNQDIAADFYLPCMAAASSYDRAVAFFRSTVFFLAWPSLRLFVERGGRIRLICSPIVSSSDAAALAEGYDARTDTDLVIRLKDQISSMLNDPILEKPTRVIATLVALEVMELQIAEVPAQPDPLVSRLFHDKVGIFKDQHGNSVVFKGSMNETWAGLSVDGNLESVDVYLSWGDAREQARVQDEVDYFNSLWRGDFPGTRVMPFPEAARKDLINAADSSLWEEWADELAIESELTSRFSGGGWAQGRKPYPHQSQALAAWIGMGRRGILQHATGSGKTFTAILAIRDCLEREEIPLILVPSQELMRQWHEEILKSTADLEPRILRCGAGNDSWRSDALLRRWTRRGRGPRIVLSTIQTAASEEFRTLIESGDHINLVADEVHRLGSPHHRKVFQIESGPRLGLSATPTRAGDPDGSIAVFDYFGEVIQPPFMLKDAIEKGFLTPYFYGIHTIKLTADEQEAWDQISNRIGRIYAIHRSEGRSPDMISEDLKPLLIRRARIAKAAREKPAAARRILEAEYEEDDRWIVYCDSQSQLGEVIQELGQAGIDSVEYHSAMEGSREQTLRRFERNGGIVVSIRCLDEGVDIPSVTHALILASSKNPREFIQRRGRVLRRAPGKLLSHVHDVLVLPNEFGIGSSTTDNRPPGLALVAGELSRAIEFGSSAINPSAVASIKRIAVENGIDIDDLVHEGYEDGE